MHLWGSLALPYLGWKTRSQLMKLHNDEQVVNRIVDMKTRSGEYKEHPDAPGDASAMLFYCVVDIEKIEEDEYQETLHLSVSGEASGEQVCRRNKNRIKQFHHQCFEMKESQSIGSCFCLIVFL